MDGPVFKNYLAAIQAHIGMHIDSAEFFKKKVDIFRTRVQNGINVKKLQIKLNKNKAELAKTCNKIDTLKNFFVNIKKRWSKLKD